MSLYGIESAGKGASETTAVAIQRSMSYYSSLPLYVDEYRNDLKVTQKNGVFRCAYNRQSMGKGLKQEFGIREGKIRGTLLIAGEETPNDNALLTRCVTVLISESKRKVNNFDWFIKNRTALSSFTYDILSHKKENLDRYLKRLVEDKDDIAKLMNDDRMAINKAVVSAGVWLLFGDNEDFTRDFIQDLTESKEIQEAESVVASFFADIKAMSVDSAFKIKDLIDLNDEKIYIYFHGLYNKWAKDYQSRNRETPFKSDAIRNYLKEEPGFQEMSTMHRFPVAGNCRAVVFTAVAAPDFIKDLFDNIVAV